MKILVSGDREWGKWTRKGPNDWTSADCQLMVSVLKQFRYGIFGDKEVPILVHGDCRGADLMAYDIVRDWGGWGVEVFPAEWKKYGKAAGAIRNKQMLDEAKPDIVIAFHRDISKSRGTANMIKIAKQRGIQASLYPVQ